MLASTRIPDWNSKKVVNIMEKKTMVIDGRMHMEGDDGLFRRDHPVYRMEDGKPVKVEPQHAENDDFTAAVASIPVNDSGLEQ